MSWQVTWATGDNEVLESPHEGKYVNDMIALVQHAVSKGATILHVVKSEDQYGLADQER